jgi:hypothetical protein
MVIVTQPDSKGFSERKDKMNLDVLEDRPVIVRMRNRQIQRSGRFLVKQNDGQRSLWVRIIGSGICAGKVVGTHDDLKVGRELWPTIIRHYANSDAFIRMDLP